MKSIIFKIAMYYLLKAACTDATPDQSTNPSTTTNNEGTEEEVPKPEEQVSSEANNTEGHQVSTLENTNGLTESQTKDAIHEMNPNLSPALASTIFVDSNRIEEVPAPIVNMFIGRSNTASESKSNYFIVSGNHLQEDYGPDSGSANQPTTEGEENSTTPSENETTGESTDNSQTTGQDGSSTTPNTDQAQSGETPSTEAPGAALRSRGFLMKKAGKAR